MGSTCDQQGLTSAVKRPRELNAGAVFVLQSKGSWVQCGYHLTTSIVAPALLSLPYALSFLGWAAGMSCILAGGLVTFYTYNLLSWVIEHHAQLGCRHLRFRDLAHDILGPRWGKYCVGPIQFICCNGAVVASCLLGGQFMKAIYLIVRPSGEMKLYEFIIIFGVLMLVLAQLPSVHSLRHINLISLLMALAYSACATIGAIDAGHTSSKRLEKRFSIVGNLEDRVFNVFNAIAIIATIYGSGIIPEIQATIEPPVKGKMFKGLCICYLIISVTYISVAVSGYWAFGNKAQSQILSNFVVNGTPLLPNWFIVMTNSFALVQIVAVSVLYLQPTNEAFEGMLGDPKKKIFSARNVIPRLISRSIAVILATLIAAMLPFFGDIMGFMGAITIIPLDFVLPALLFNVSFKPSKRKFTYWLNLAIMLVFSTLAVIGSVAATRQIILDAKTYKLFANL